VPSGTKPSLQQVQPICVELLLKTSYTCRFLADTANTSTEAETGPKQPNSNNFALIFSQTVQAFSKIHR
jgi:hypothetical protein